MTDRPYCPNRECGEWIDNRSSKYNSTSGMQYGHCRRCNTKVCLLCMKEFHAGEDCQKDSTTKKKTMSRRCFNCKIIVEFEEGYSSVAW